VKITLDGNLLKATTDTRAKEQNGDEEKRQVKIGRKLRITYLRITTLITAGQASFIFAMGPWMGQNGIKNQIPWGSGG